MSQVHSTLYNIVSTSSFILILVLTMLFLYLSSVYNIRNITDADIIKKIAI